MTRSCEFVIHGVLAGERHPGRCRRCGAATPRDARYYCSSRHKRAANKMRREGALTTPPAPGLCWCGERFAPFSRRDRAYCSPSCREEQEREQRQPFKEFLARVKWPHDLAWLGDKLGLQPDDPRLPTVALKLAEAGRLVVYVRADGTVGEVGKPLPPSRSEAARAAGEEE